MPTLFIAGDSTASCKKESVRPESGWGEYLTEFISPNLKVNNLAENGRSTKSFIDAGLLKIIDQNIQEDDYLLIQFGHNDQNSDDLLRYTTPFGTYLEHINQMVIVAKKHLAIPILITPITRRKFSGDHQIDTHNLGDYPEAMRMFAKKNKLYLIDLYQITQKLIQDLGVDHSKHLYLHLSPQKHQNYPKGIVDDTHLNAYGAKVVASIIAQELKKII